MHWVPRIPSAPLRGDPPPIPIKIYARFLLQTITTTSARGLMVGGSASTPSVHIDVEPIALVEPRPVGSVPPTPDLDYGDLRKRQVRSGELVIPCNLDTRQWRLTKVTTTCSQVPKAPTLLRYLPREPRG